MICITRKKNAALMYRCRTVCCILKWFKSMKETRFFTWCRADSSIILFPFFWVRPFWRVCVLRYTGALIIRVLGKFLRCLNVELCRVWGKKQESPCLFMIPMASQQPKPKLLSGISCSIYFHYFVENYK